VVAHQSQMREVFILDTPVVDDQNALVLRRRENLYPQLAPAGAS